MPDLISLPRTRIRGYQDEVIMDSGWILPASVCGGFISLLPASGWLAGMTTLALIIAGVINLPFL